MAIMNFVGWVVLGLLLGILANLIDSGQSREGFIKTIALGIGGALLGGTFWSLIYKSGLDGLNLQSIFIATLSAFILLYIGRSLRKI